MAIGPNGAWLAVKAIEECDLRRFTAGQDLPMAETSRSGLFPVWPDGGPRRLDRADDAVLAADPR